MTIDYWLIITSGEGKKRGGGGKEEEEREEEQAGRRRDTDGTQAGHEEEEEKTGAEGAGAVGFGLIDSCAYSSIVSLFLQITNSIYFTHFGIRLSLSRRGSDS